MHGEKEANHNMKIQLAKESQVRLKGALVEGFEYDHVVVAKSDEYLRKHAFQKLSFGVMYVDLVGSTVMSTELAPESLSKIITIFSQEVAYTIEHFRGLVLKFVGDSVIGYFPHIRKYDDIIRCGESIIFVAREAVNPLLLQMGFKGIEVKISADYGLHTIVRYGSDSVNSHVDIISATMNLAAKMQSVTHQSQIMIGKTLYERLNAHSKRLFKKAAIGRGRWNYHNLAKKKPYQLYLANL